MCYLLNKLFNLENPFFAALLAALPVAIAPFFAPFFASCIAYFATTDAHLLAFSLLIGCFFAIIKFFNIKAQIYNIFLSVGNFSFIFFQHKSKLEELNPIVYNVWYKTSSGINSNNLSN